MLFDRSGIDAGLPNDGGCQIKLTWKKFVFSQVADSFSLMEYNSLLFYSQSEGGLLWLKLFL